MSPPGPRLTHLDAEGRARMVDVSDKLATVREAVAEGFLRMAPTTLELALRVQARVRARGPTGVEMEALTACSVACLTLYDMLKAADKQMVIEGVRVLEKTGGASGDYRA